MKSKKEIRKEILAKREELSEEYYEQATQAIHDKLLNFDLYKEAQTIYIFYSMGKELDTKKIIEHAHQEGKRVGIPRTVKLGEMVFHQYEPGDPLITAKYGAEEPSEDAPVIPIEEVDLIIMPCVSCNDKGERIGYGGGFYDRVLENYEGPTVLPYFSKLQTLEIPMEEHDKKMDYVITEKSIVHVLE